MNVEKNKNILKRRAEKLAKSIESDDSAADSIEVLIFELGEEKYGIETKYISEVYPLKNHTLLPCVPSFVYGLANVRRKIVLIVDLKVLFSIPDDKTAPKKLIILGNDESGFSIVTDGLSEIQRISKDKLQTSLPTLTGVREDFLKGLMTDGTVILDGQKLLTSQYLIVNESV